MKVLSTFQIRSLVHLPVSPTQSRIEANISNDADVEASDESVAFSVLIRHKDNSSPQDLQSIALQRAQDILASQRSGVSKRASQKHRA